MSQNSLDWRATTRWFASEYLVVVVGVLTAMALASWAGKREESKREQAYLRQLDADLATTLAIIAHDDSVLSPADYAGNLFVRAFLAAHRPPADSLAAWLLRASHDGPARLDPRPVLGTANALIASGDIRLIANDSLRSAITAYVERARQLAEQQQRFWELWRDGHAAVQVAVDYSEMIQALETPAAIDSAALANPRYLIPAGARRRAFPLNWDAVLTNQRVYQGARDMSTAKSNLSYIRNDMRGLATQLRTFIVRVRQKD